MIRIDLNLNNKINKLDNVYMNVNTALAEGFRKTEDDILSEISQMFPEKAHWFKVTSDHISGEIKITPSDDVSSSEEKMRLYRYFIDVRRDELTSSAARCLRRNIVDKYKENVVGGINVN